MTVLDSEWHGASSSYVMSCNGRLKKIKKKKGQAVETLKKSIVKVRALSSGDFMCEI